MAIASEASEGCVRGCPNAASEGYAFRERENWLGVVFVFVFAIVCTCVLCLRPVKTYLLGAETWLVKPSMFGPHCQWPLFPTTFIFFPQGSPPPHEESHHPVAT
jgi:hypothetical protein